MASAYCLTLVFLFGLVVLRTSATAEGGDASSEQQQKVFVDRLNAKIKNKPRDSQETLKTNVHMAEEPKSKTAGCPPNKETEMEKPLKPATNLNQADETPKSKAAGCPPNAENELQKSEKPANLEAVAMRKGEEAPKSKAAGCPPNTEKEFEKLPKPADYHPEATTKPKAGCPPNSKK